MEYLILQKFIINLNFGRNRKLFSKTGSWMYDLLGELWFNSVFHQHCGPRRPQLLILDSHSSHEVLRLLEAAILNNIMIMALHPHTSHHLQPLDKSVFGPFSKAYDRACSEFMADHPDHQVNKATLPRLFKSAWSKSMAADNIKSGFRATGIWPMDVSALPEYVYLPSEAFEVPLDAQIPTTSAPLDSSLSLLAETAVSLFALPDSNIPSDQARHDGNCRRVDTRLHGFSAWMLRFHPQTSKFGERRSSTCYH
jgi:hypothetical protein